MSDIDSLQININATATKANDALDNLVKKLDKLTTSLSSIDGSKLSGLASGVSQLGLAMQTMNAVKTTDFASLVKNLSNLNKLDTSKISGVSANISKIGTAVSGLSGVSQGVTQITELANGIKQLGYKSADKAIDNIPKLATAMKQLMKELSTAPKVSQNLIDMTNALARLARTGASSGKAAQSLSSSFTGAYKSSGFAVSGIKKINSHLVGLTRSIIPVIGAIGLIDLGKQAMEISSDLTEVQNVVDVTFGDYKQKIEDLASVSIPELGMSELSVKEIGSRFQAMGTAMGFSTEKMSDMSVELTRLTGDMASFYNVGQEDMGKALQSIFTGEAEPMRKYGIDLTDATIQQYALSQGITTSINKMTQLEKAQLRYSYVMAQTTAAQGDFIRTQDTWANQVRILKQNLQQLASIIGGSLINAFKPLVQALNSAMSYVISFAETVSNALGKIFGWKFEVGGGVTNDLETGADAADDIADSTGEAAKNIEKMQKGARVFDELKSISTSPSTSNSSTSEAGDIGTGVASNGEWVQQGSIFEEFESEIDSLYKMGEYIGDALTDAMNSIDWQSIYEKARGFGTGLAQFLNGLISPELFGATGRTIASALNTAIYTALSFGETFDWENLGESIAEGINQFFATFDFAALAETINVWVQGIWTAIKTTLENIKWENVWNGAKEFLENIDLETIEIVLGAIAIKKILGIHLASTALSMIGTSLSRSIAQGIASKLGIEIAANAGIKTALTTGLTTAFTSIGTTFMAGLKGLFGSEAATSALTFISPVIKAITGIGSVIGGVAITVSNFFSMWKNGFSWLNEALMVLGTALAAVGAVILGAPALVAGIVAAVVAAVGTIVVVVHDNWDAIKEWFAGIGEWFNTTIIQPIKNAFSTLTEKVGGFFSSLWEKITSIWGTVSSWFSTNVIEPVVNFFVGFATRVQQIFEGLWIIIQAVWGIVSEFFNEYIITPITNTITTIIEWITETLTTLWDGIQEIWGTVSSWFSTNVIEPVVNFFVGFATRVQQIFEGLWIIIQAVWGIVSEFFNEYIITPITNAITTIIEWITETLTTLWDGIQEIWGTVSSWFSTNVIEPVVNFFVGFATKVQQIFEGLWIIIQAVWGIVSEFFNEYIITPITNAITTIIEWITETLTTLWDGIQEIWFTISSIFDEYVIAPIAELFSFLWEGIKKIWGKVSEWFDKNVITPVSKAFKTVCKKISGFFDNLWLGIKKGVSMAFNVVIGVVESALNWLVDAINAIIGGFNRVVSWAASVIEVDWGGVDLLPKVSLGRIDVSGFELGGFPKEYSLFMAGEHGTAEMLGTVGGKTAVAGGAEITGISDTIRETSSEEIQLLRQQNMLLQALLEKETGISKDDVGKAAQSYARDYFRRTGREAYSF